MLVDTNQRMGHLGFISTQIFSFVKIASKVNIGNFSVGKVNSFFKISLHKFLHKLMPESRFSVKMYASLL